MEFNVPTMKSSEDGENIKKTILTSEPNANVTVDTDAKKVTVDGEASAETFRQLITACGHEVK